ncbi:hypothetical protein SUGI_0092500 [Cryptomeria japonica]|nr:hypothetical protein SUGI_0092500 [Cryptomeria japonica]
MGVVASLMFWRNMRTSFYFHDMELSRSKVDDVDKRAQKAQQSKQEFMIYVPHNIRGPVSVAVPLDCDGGFINKDLRPTSVEERSFSGWEMTSMWIGMVVGVPSYYMAGSFVEIGMAWWQGIATVMAGNPLYFVQSPRFLSLPITFHNWPRNRVPRTATNQV